MPKNPPVALNDENKMEGARAVRKRAKPAPEPSAIDRGVDAIRQLVGRVADGVKQIGRGSAEQQPEPAPVIPR